LADLSTCGALSPCSRSERGYGKAASNGIVIDSGGALAAVGARRSISWTKIITSIRCVVAFSLCERGPDGVPFVRS
jgi:hypothetical protein